MTVEPWPAILPQRPLRDGLRLSVRGACTRVSMEQGPARQRLRYTDAPARLALKWRMSLPEFSFFRAFYRLDLRQGAAWVDLPAWAGGGVARLEARFSDRYSAAPRGPSAVTVSAEMELRTLPVMSEAEALALVETGASGLPCWPDVLPDTLLADGTALDPHEPLLRSDIEAGPAEKRAGFGVSSATVTLRWFMSAAQYEAFTGLFHWPLARGAGWVEMPVWTGTEVIRAAARFTDGYECEPRGASGVIVSASVELRELPAPLDGVTYLFGMLGEPGLTAFAGGIHHFVHVSYPEAA